MFLLVFNEVSRCCTAEDWIIKSIYGLLKKEKMNYDRAEIYFLEPKSI